MRNRPRPSSASSAGLVMSGTVRDLSMTAIFTLCGAGRLTVTRSRLHSVCWTELPTSSETISVAVSTRSPTPQVLRAALMSRRARRADSGSHGIVSLYAGAPIEVGLAAVVVTGNPSDGTAQPGYGARGTGPLLH